MMSRKPDKPDKIIKYLIPPWYLDLWLQESKTHSLLYGIFILMLEAE